MYLLIIIFIIETDTIFKIMNNLKIYRRNSKDYIKPKPIGWKYYFYSLKQRNIKDINNSIIIIKKNSHMEDFLYFEKRKKYSTSYILIPA